MTEKVPIILHINIKMMVPIATHFFSQERLGMELLRSTMGLGFRMRGANRHPSFLPGAPRHGAASQHPGRFQALGRQAAERRLALPKVLTSCGLRKQYPSRARGSVVHC